jgi:hypothetical protein
VHDLPGFLNVSPEGQPASSQLNPHTYWAIDTILSRLDEGIALTQEALRRHTVAQAQQKTTTITFAPRVQGIMAQLQPAHPQGFTPSPTDPARWILSLEGTVRHLYFEALTHLYNIQRLKRAQGLSTCVDFPRVGYYVLPGWDNDLQEGTEASETDIPCGRSPLVSLSILDTQESGLPRHCLHAPVGQGCGRLWSSLPAGAVHR